MAAMLHCMAAIVSDLNLRCLGKKYQIEPDTALQLPKLC